MVKYNNYSLVNAVHTGQAKCKRCREKIAKGSVRLGVPYHSQYGGMSTAWRHLECCLEAPEDHGDADSIFGTPRLPKSLEALAGWNELTDVDKATCEAHFATQWQATEPTPSGREKGKKKKAEPKTKKSAIGKKKARKGADNTAVEAPPGAVKQPLVVD